MYPSPVVVVVVVYKLMSLSSAVLTMNYEKLIKIVTSGSHLHANGKGEGRRGSSVKRRCASDT